MTPEQVRERAAELADKQAEADRISGASTELVLSAIVTANQISRAIRAIQIPPTPPDILAWAVERWKDEVSGRPLRNRHRRALDDSWRQVIRFAGGDPNELLGPSHDELIDQQGDPTPPDPSAEALKLAEEALRPFAAHAENWAEEYADGDSVRILVFMRDLRRAANALAAIRKITGVV